MSTLSRRSKRTPFRKNVLNEISHKSNLNHSAVVQDCTKFPSFIKKCTPTICERYHKRSMLAVL